MKRSSGAALLFGIAAGLALLSTGCAIKIPMNPIVGALDIEEKVPADAALLITWQTRGYLFKGLPDSSPGGTRPHIFPLGYALESASLQAFSQVFRKVEVVRTPEEAKKYIICIEPKIEVFRFRHDQEDKVLVLVDYSVSTMKISATISSGDSILCTRSFISPEMRAGASVQFNVGHAQDCGTAASNAMAYSLAQLARALSGDDAVRQHVARARRP